MPNISHFTNLTKEGCFAIHMPAEHGPYARLVTHLPIQHPHGSLPKPRVHKSSRSICGRSLSHHHVSQMLPWLSGRLSHSCPIGSTRVHQPTIMSGHHMLVVPESQEEGARPHARVVTTSGPSWPSTVPPPKRDPQHLPLVVLKICHPRLEKPPRTPVKVLTPTRVR